MPYSDDETTRALALHKISFPKISVPTIKVGGTAGKILEKIGNPLDRIGNLDPNNPNNELQKIYHETQHFVKYPLDTLEQIWVTPLIYAFIENLERQAVHRKKSLPEWLKVKIHPFYPKIDLNRVRYAENINIPSLIGQAAMTIGYTIYIPTTISIDHEQTILNVEQDTWLFTYNTHLILHELEHTNQYLSVSGSKSAFVIKYCGSVIPNLGVPQDQIHDMLPMEVQAEDKANSIINTVLDYFSLGRQTDLLKLNTHGRTPHRMFVSQDATRPVGSLIGGTPITGVNDPTWYGWINGNWLESRNMAFVFAIEGDGNLGIYANATRALLWQSHTSGKAAPPFFLGCNDDRSALLLRGMNWRSTAVKDYYPIYKPIFQSTSPYTGGPNTSGGLYLWDPTAVSSSASRPHQLFLELSDLGQLELYAEYYPPATFADRRRIWWTPLINGGISTTVLWPTETTLPAAVHH